MFRIKFLISTLFLILIGCRTHVDLGYQDLSSNGQIITGTLVVRSNNTICNCIEQCQKEILHKFLYEGFEETPFWRPQELIKELRDEKQVNRLLNNIYITQSNQLKGKNCKCRFQFNIASTRKILENEGYIPAFGY